MASRAIRLSSPSHMKWRNPRPNAHKKRGRRLNTCMMCHVVHFTALPGVGHEIDQQIAAGVWQDLKNHRLDE